MVKDNKINAVKITAVEITAKKVENVRIGNTYKAGDIVSEGSVHVGPTNIRGGSEN